MSATKSWMDDYSNPIDLRTDRAHPARVYDYLLGGKTNYAPDREMGQRVLENVPTAEVTAREGRNFMHRVVRYLTEEVGIRQFLDVGTGIPTSPNLHELAQNVAPETRVVYADNDPIVLAHSRALHQSKSEGRTAYIQADASDPDSILDSAELAETLDLSQPVALTLSLLLHWLPQQVDAYEVVRKLVKALAPGSYLMIAHVANDIVPRHAVSRISNDFQESGGQMNPRNRDEVLRFFDGLSLITPGLVVPQQWRPEPPHVHGLRAVPEPISADDVPIWAGVALKNA